MPRWASELVLPWWSWGGAFLEGVSTIPVQVWRIGGLRGIGQWDGCGDSSIRTMPGMTPRGGPPCGWGTRLRTRQDDARVIRLHDGLDAVAHAQLRQDAV